MSNSNSGATLSISPKHSSVPDIAVLTVRGDALVFSELSPTYNTVFGEYLEDL